MLRKFCDILIFFSCFLLPLCSFSQTLNSFNLEQPGHIAMWVAFNPDSRLLASAGQENKIILWDVESKQLVNTFTGHTDAIIALDYSKDGNFIASGGKDKEVILWSVRNGIEEKRFKEHTGYITCLAFSPNNQYLVSGSTDKSIIVWDIPNNIKETKIQEHQDDISALAFNPEGTLLVSASWDGSIKFYDTKTWEVIKKISPNAGRIRSVSFSSDGKQIAAGTEKKALLIWDVDLGYLKQTHSFHKDVVYDTEFSADDKYLFTGSLDNTLRIYNDSIQKVQYELKDFYHLVSFSVSPNGKYLATADFSKRIKVYDLKPLAIKPLKTKFKIPGLITNRSTGKFTTEINLIQPNVQKDSVFAVHDKTLIVKGQVLGDIGVFEIKVNEVETTVNADGFFSVEIRVPYGVRENIVKVIDLANNEYTQTFKTNRILNTDKNEAVNRGRTGKDYALLIGTNEYDNMPRLINPVFDATTIANELKTTYGFDTKLITNPTRVDLLNTLRTYSKQQFSDEDQLFIFIAGHGIHDQYFNEGYIVSKDSKAKDEVKDSYISHSNLRNILDNIPCKHVMLVLDVCFGGTFAPLSGHRGDENYDEVEKELFIQRKMQYVTRKYLTSGGKTYVPDGIPGNHSPFARKFLEALRTRGGKDGILTFGEIIPFIEKVHPEPKMGEFGKNEPGSDFLFITK